MNTWSTPLTDRITNVNVNINVNKKKERGTGTSAGLVAAAPSLAAAITDSVKQITANT